MADNAPDAVQVKSPAKTQRKKRASAGRMNALPLVKLIVDAVTEMKERKGTSMFKIKKFLAGKGVDVKSSNSRINRTVKNMVARGDLKQLTGRGASGCFKIPTKPAPKPAKPATKAATKTATKTATKAKGGKKGKSATPKKADSKKTAVKRPAGPKRTPLKQKAKKKVSKKETKNKVAKRSTKKSSPKKSTTAKRAPAKRATATKVKVKKTAAKKGGAKKSSK